ncbi:hypothetical protein GTR02_16610 [Kineococcus sp. R8]|uniref:HNH endonuclease signature motif containing protein n=1 Tax=Kineococcus siccus TaxID=2696567 RepID=UPI0014136083|nr:HNH endonuclease signature motif containing protein [Kineococcus siccus]NAZ83442.1 hypothetical protein [Kineococcus siccus]
MRRPAAVAAGAGALLVLLTGCSLGAQPQPGAQRAPGPAVTVLPVPDVAPVEQAAARERFRRAADGTLLPDATTTPGSVFADVTQADLCGPRYSAGVRRERSADGDEVRTAYGVDGDRSAYSVDHLVPVSLGGDNRVANLWPQPRDGQFALAAKDTLEGHLRGLVCQGTVPLEEARTAIAQDWRAAYDRYMPLPLAVAVSPPPPAAPAPDAVAAGRPCPTEGVVALSADKGVRLVCRPTAEGVLQWQRRG